LVSDPNNDLVFWSGGGFQFATVFSRTTNCGTSWTRYILAGVGCGNTIAVAPSNSNVVYAGGQGMAGQPWFFKTTSCGASWDTITTLSGTMNIYCLAIHPSDPDIVFAGKADGVFRSTNGGATWTNTGLADVNSIVIDPSAPDTVYAGTNNGVYVSSTGGGGWSAMNTGLANQVITGMGIDPDHYLYAGTHGAGMYSWSIAPGVDERWYRQAPLFAAYPNPTRGQTTITYQLAKAAHVSITIYDIQGRVVRTIINETLGTGARQAVWSGNDENNEPVAAGVYFCAFTHGAATSIRKLVVMR
jgi:hypothetical protein